MSRSVFWRCSVKKVFVKFTWKHLCQSLFFNKVAGLGSFWVDILKSVVRSHSYKELIKVLYVLKGKNYTSLQECSFIASKNKFFLIFKNLDVTASELSVKTEFLIMPEFFAVNSDTQKSTFWKLFTKTSFWAKELLKWNIWDRTLSRSFPLSPFNFFFAVWDFINNPSVNPFVPSALFLHRL